MKSGDKYQFECEGLTIDAERDDCGLTFATSADDQGLLVAATDNENIQEKVAEALKALRLAREDAAQLEL